MTDTTSAAPAVAVPSESEKAIRRLLCSIYAGPLAYTDDGEAQDNREHPHIDFMRDSADEIQAKMQRRGLKNLSSAAPQPQAEVPATPWPIAPDVAAELERSDWTPEEALRWYAAGRHYDTVPNGDGSRSTRILDNGAVASNALKSLSREYAEHKGDVALQGGVFLTVREISEQTGLPLHTDENGAEYISSEDMEPGAAYAVNATSNVLPVLSADELHRICDGVDDSMPVGYVSGAQINEKVSLNFHDVASATAWFERFMSEYETAMLNRKGNHE